MLLKLIFLVSKNKTFLEIRFEMLCVFLVSFRLASYLNRLRCKDRPLFMLNMQKRLLIFSSYFLHCNTKLAVECVADKKDCE